MRLSSTVSATLASLALLGGCAAPVKPEGADTARRALVALKLNAVLAAQVPAALADAELAVQAAEIPTRDLAAGQHAAHVALRKVEIARIEAERRVAENTLQQLTQQREAIVRDNQQREQEIASAQAEAAARAQQLAAQAAQQQAARTLVLRSELSALQAQGTERGDLLTLDDAMFLPGKADLQPAATERLDRLAGFMNRFVDRRLLVEAYCDLRGSDPASQKLSEQRAEAVKVYLIIQSIESSRITAVGRGRPAPAAAQTGSESPAQGSRVDILISN